MKSDILKYLYFLGIAIAKRLFYTNTKHLLKFEKNQADNLAAVENRFILALGADFFLYFIGV